MELGGLMMLGGLTTLVLGWLLGSAEMILIGGLLFAANHELWKED